MSIIEVNVKHSSIHEDIRNLLNEIHKKHGVTIKNIDVSWIDYSTLSEEIKRVASMDVTFNCQSGDL
jgi:hypothetical protein